MHQPMNATRSTLDDLVNNLDRRSCSLPAFTQAAKLALRLRQIDLAYDEDETPAGCLLWAYLDTQSFRRKVVLVEGLHPSDWNAGTNLRVVGWAYRASAGRGVLRQSVMRLRHLAQRGARL